MNSPLYDELKARINLADLINETHALQANGAEHVACCPFHSERTPSFTVYEDRAKGWRYHCHGCSANGDAIDWMEKQRGMSHADAVRELSQRAGLVASPTSQQSPRIGSASEVWQRSQPGNGHVQAYLASRGLHMDGPPAPLRQLDSLPYSHDRQIIGSYPVMLSPVVLSLPTPGEHLQPVAVHRTYLQADGAGKADVPVARKLLGKAAGGFVPLADPRGGDTLALAEGIEDALAVMLATGLPCWAVMSAGNMPKVIANVPDCVTKLRIFADDDKAGTKAARETEAAWRVARGRTADVVTILPPGACKDANASYVQDRGAGLRAALTEAIGAAQADSGILNAADWLSGGAADMPPPVPLIRGLIDVGDKMMIAGASKSRKSWFTLELAMNLASTSTNFLGLEVVGQKRVLILQPEIAPVHYQRRCKRLMQHVGSPGFALSARDRFGDRLAIKNCRGLDVHQMLVDGTIEQYALQHRADLIVLDPLYKFLSTGREDHEDFRNFILHADRLIAATGAALFYVHHYAKGTAGDRSSLDRASGSGLLSRDVDASVALTQHKDDALLVLEVEPRNYAPMRAQTLQWCPERGRFQLSQAAPEPRQSRMRKARPKPTAEQVHALFAGSKQSRTKTACIELLQTIGTKAHAREIFKELLASGEMQHAGTKPPEKTGGRPADVWIFADKTE